MEPIGAAQGDMGLISCGIGTIWVAWGPTLVHGAQTGPETSSMPLTCVPFSQVAQLHQEGKI